MTEQIFREAALESYACGHVGARRTLRIGSGLGETAAIAVSIGVMAAVMYGLRVPEYRRAQGTVVAVDGSAARVRVEATTSADLGPVRKLLVRDSETGRFISAAVLPMSDCGHHLQSDGAEVCIVLAPSLLGPARAPGPGEWQLMVPTGSIPLIFALAKRPTR